MKNLVKNLFSFALVGLVIASCGNPAKMAEKAELLTVNCDPQPLEVVADKIQATVSVNFPNEFFHPKGIVEVVPVLVYKGGEEVGRTVMLQGEKVTENYKTVPESGATVSESFVFNYVKGVEKSHLELRMTVLHKGKKYPFPAAKVADGANATYKLVQKPGMLAYAPDAYQDVIDEKGEAQVLYLINSAAVRPSQLKSDDIASFQEFLKEVKDDERRTIKNTEIISYASPDGTLNFNTGLSERRAMAANKAFENKINKSVGIDAPIISEAISEDWDGFKELVENSNIEDKDLIIRVLEMYSDPMVREKEIKNMSSVFSTLAKEVLPQLRRTRFITNIEFQNYTSQELIALLDENIEILDAEALLRAATLVEDNDSKLAIYNKAIDKFNCDRAKVNAAVTYLVMSEVDKAESVLAKVSEKDDYYYNTVGVVALRNNDLEAASAEFAKSSLKEAKYNQAIIDILEGDYNGAVAKLAGSGLHNEVLAYILVNNMPQAEVLMAKHDCKCAMGAYMKAIIAARQGKVSEAKEALAVVAEGPLAGRATYDIEFAKIR